jgi:hypothetical protein
MANEAAKTQTINIVPVQGIFQPEPTFALISLIGPAGTPFYPIIDPNQSGLNITNSTIDSSTIGATTPSTGVFTDIATTTGTISSAPSGPTSIVNQAYVDAIAQGLAFKAPANYTTTGNITLSGLAVQAGGDWNVTLTAGNRILVKDQTTGANNGIYLAASGAWTRSLDANTYDELLSAYLFVLDGVTLAGSAWVDTNLPGGTLGVTPITFVRFSNTAVYSAGTGLTLSSYQFSITPVGTAGTYGSASAVPVFVTNASGQVTSVTNTAIAIANTQVSGLGTMSTQNATSVAITGGTINGATIGASSAAAITGTTITANSYFSGAGTGLTGTASGLSIGGNAATATSAGSVTNSLTINSGGSGGTSPQTYNGGTAVTVSYNTVGAPSITGTNASGTWGISITGNSATVTNGLYSTGSYSNPTWLTSILGSIVSGAVSTATTATNVAGGAAGSLVYQSAAATTTTLALGTTNYVLTAGASAPQYVAQSTLSVGSATTATTATNLAGGGAGYIPYQSGAGTTAFLASGTTGQVLTSNGTSAPTWSTPTSYATVTDDTTTAATRYPLFANQTTGNLTTEYVSSTKLQYNPSTGVFTATGFSGSGASLTSLTAGNLSGTIPSGVLGNSTVYIGTTAVALNRASGSISLTGTSIDGSAGSATTATTATTATNATNIAITDNTSSSSTWYPVISANSSGNNPATTSSTKLSFVPNTGVLSATGFSGAGTGLTGTASSLSIGGTATTATNIASGANLQIPYNTASGTTSFIAAPTIASTYLQYNGTGFTWATAAGVGTVTSVGQSFTGGLISVSGSPITTTGTLALTVAGTSGGIPYFSSASAWASSAALTQYGVIYGGGAGNAPVATAAGTTGQVLIATTSAAPSWGQVSLTAGVTGTLPVANGGTGVTSSTGSGSVVLGTSPTISSPTINGTPVMGASILTSGTAVASTSGTSINFTSIPSWVKRINVIFDLTSTNGSSNLLMQIGNGSVITSGYTSLCLYAGGSSNTGSATSTAGCLLTGVNGAAVQATGSLQLILQTSNTWILSGTLTQVSFNQVSFSSGRIALGGALDRIRITTVNGTDTFDNGTINIIYE